MHIMICAYCGKQDTVMYINHEHKLLCNRDCAEYNKTTSQLEAVRGIIIKGDKEDNMAGNGMTNVKATVSKDGKKLTLEVDLTEQHGLSGSGKTVKVASTGGFVWNQIEDIGFSLNVNKFAR